MAPATEAEIPELVTTKWVADMFSVTTETVRDWITRGHIKGRLINGYWRVEKKSVIDYANRKYGS